MPPKRIDVTVVPVPRWSVSANKDDVVVFTATQDCALHIHDDKMFGVKKTILKANKPVELTVLVSQGETFFRAVTPPKAGATRGDPTDIIVP
jgi:hypothetical protein